MIKVDEIKLDPQTETALVTLFSDTKGEVIPGATIEGLPDGYEVAFGSSVLTAEGEMGFMKSDGTWNWV